MMSIMKSMSVKIKKRFDGEEPSLVIARPPIDVILTSCGRFDLLESTLDSFFYLNDYPINNFFIYEDSGTLYRRQPDINHLEILKQKYPQVTWLISKQKDGQIYALDALWGRVTTKYCFQMEDDWVFYRRNFISDSIEILEQRDDIIMCWIRERNDVNSHPIENNVIDGFDYMMMNYNLMWDGYTFNPSVKRLSDYQKIGTFGGRVRHYEAWRNESGISKAYGDMGYRAIILPHGYMRHIGNKRGIR